MDLETSTRPLAEFADPTTIATIVVLLAFVPFLLAAATTLLLAPGKRTLKQLLQGGLRTRGILRRIPRKIAAGICLILLPFAVVTDLNLLRELLLLEHGSWLAVLAVVLGALTGMAVAQRPRHKPLLIAAASAAALAVLASILFAGQFDERVTGDDRTTAPTASATPTRGAPAPTAGTTAAPTPGTTTAPTQAPANANAGILATTMGDFATEPICLDGYGTEPVAVTVTGLYTIDVRLPGGEVVQVGDAAQLHPCSRREGASSQEVYAPGKAFEQFDGTPYRIVGQRGVAVIARVTAAGGQEFLWVWRGQDGVTLHGLLAASDVQ